MSNRKAFSQVLEKLHQGRILPAHQTATRVKSRTSKQKGEPGKQPKDPSSGASSSKSSGREGEEPKSKTAARKQDKKLDCGDLDERYGKLNLTAVNSAAQSCAALSPILPAETPFDSECNSPMQCQVTQWRKSAYQVAISTCNSVFIVRMHY